MSERLKLWAILLIVVAVVTAAGYATYKVSAEKAATRESLARLTSNALPDLSGAPHRLSDWKGKVLVVNFWATWCEPCREEIPGLVRVQSKLGVNGLAIVGIAVDSVDKVRDFAQKYAINYSVLIGGLESVGLLRDLGDQAGGLPYTLILNRNGELVTTHLGRISEQELEQTASSLLQ